MNERRKRVLKISLDAGMLLLLSLMYKKQAFGIAFHEIGVLALIGIFVIHHLLNGKWIASVTKRLFSKTLPGRVRAGYIVDALLLAAFLTIGITGALMSKVVFSFGFRGGDVKIWHYFASAIAVILTGVHLGLHGDYLWGKVVRKASKAGKILLAAGLAAVMAFGNWSLASTSMLSHLSAPFGFMGGGGEGASRNAVAEVEAHSGGTEVLQDAPEESQQNQADSAIDTGEESGHGQNGMSNGGQGKGYGNGSGLGKGAGSQGQGMGDGGGIAGAALLAAQYVSIMILIGALSYGVSSLFSQRGRSASNGRKSEERDGQ